MGAFQTASHGKVTCVSVEGRRREQTGGLGFDLGSSRGFGAGWPFYAESHFENPVSEPTPLPVRQNSELSAGALGRADSCPALLLLELPQAGHAVLPQARAGERRGFSKIRAQEEASILGA